MISAILKQIWNKRNSNVYLFLELVLVTFFMWGVIDPVYVLLSNRSIDQGYDVDQVLLLRTGVYPSNHSRYKEEFDSDSMAVASYIRIYDLVKQHPDVESSVPIWQGNHPYSGSYNGRQVCRDSIITHAMQINFYNQGDFFRVFRIKDVNGNYPEEREWQSGHIFLTQDVVNKLFTDENPVGKEVLSGDRTTTQVLGGVIPHFKYHSTEQPIPTCFIPYDFSRITPGRLPYTEICIRIQEGISKAVFMERFKQEMAPQLSIGNFYFQEILDFEQICSHTEFTFGVTNTLRLRIGLSLFFLVCTFLGISGTFWLRSDARRSEIGLRMSLGSTRKNILKEFLCESWLITTLAWLLGILLVLQRVFYTGFANPPQYANSAYLQNRFVPHFLIVSLIVYVLLILITLVGTWIPAQRAAHTEPANALRDE